MLFRPLLVGTALLGVFAVSINGQPHGEGFDMCYLCSTFFAKAITLFNLGDRPKVEASFTKYCDTLKFGPIIGTCKSFVDIALQTIDWHEQPSPELFCRKKRFCNSKHASFLPIVKFIESLECQSKVDFEKDKYRVVDKKMSVNDATRFCKSKGMRLVSIRNQQESEAVQFALSDQAEDSWTFWTSGKRFGSDTDNYWKWSDEELAWPARNKRGQDDGRFRNWYPGEPNNHGGHEDCIQISIAHNNGKSALAWNDLDCSLPLRVICEKL